MENSCNLVFQNKENSRNKIPHQLYEIVISESKHYIKFHKLYHISELQELSDVLHRLIQLNTNDLNSSTTSVLALHQRLVSDT